MAAADRDSLGIQQVTQHPAARERELQVQFVHPAHQRQIGGRHWARQIIDAASADYVQSMLEGGPDRERRLIHRTDKVSVGVKTWGEILDENNARLQFVKEALEHNADDGQALAFLEERHREFLEGVIIQDDAEDQEDRQRTPEAAEASEAD